ncbi:MAG: hypothetical protein JW700_02440 [Candidatus Aenigmarchaeota archaeon]|nr:hypothetical protein [Candidatus Aenigmarchaeota archaeon]
MINELDEYLKDVQAADLASLETSITSNVLDPLENPISFNIKLRKNPAFGTKSRIDLERETRRVELTAELKPRALMNDCMFCDPKKCANFAPETGLEKQYIQNKAITFSNWYASGIIHGIIVYNYTTHITNPIDLSHEEWVDGLSLVRKIGKLTKKKYVSLHNNYGLKAAASLEHFHGQYHCEDEPLAMTKRTMKNADKGYWKSWVKALNNMNLVLDFDQKTKTVFFVEWSPAFGKVELVIMNLENPSFVNLSDDEIDAVAKYMHRSVRIIREISDQFNVLNFSAALDDNYCNHFRIIPRAPMTISLKAWQGYLEFMGETVPHIDPNKLADAARDMS